MRFLLDSKHYVDDQFLEAGVIVGDFVEGQPAPAHPWRYTRENRRLGVTAGQAMPPTNFMIPLDDEAKKLYKDTFGEAAPDRDPLAPIPLQGNVAQQPAPGVSPQGATIPRSPQPTPSGMTTPRPVSPPEPRPAPTPPEVKK